MTGKIKNSLKLTAASWRAKAYGLVQEGRKYRFSNSFLRHSAWITGLGILAIQLGLSFTPSFKKNTQAYFAIPQVISDPSQYAPPLSDAKRDAEIEKRKKAGMFVVRALPPIEKIKPISLSGLNGIPTGSEVMAQLASGGANGMVKALTLESMLSQGDVLLPHGTVLIGKGSSADDRLYIVFKKAILPDKTEVKIKAQAFDQNDRIIGLKGKKISDYAFKLAAGAGLIFLGGVADGLRDDNTSGPFVQRRPTMRDAALNGVSTSTSDLSRQTIESMRNSQERVVVDHSSRLIVIFGDIDATD